MPSFALTMAYGLRRLLLAGLLLRGYVAVGCILGCGDWADRLACLMYLSGCLYIIFLMASDIPSSMVSTFYWVWMGMEILGYLVSGAGLHDKYAFSIPKIQYTLTWRD